MNAHEAKKITLEVFRKEGEEHIALLKRRTLPLIDRAARKGEFYIKVSIPDKLVNCTIIFFNNLGYCVSTSVSNYRYVLNTIVTISWR